MKRGWMHDDLLVLFADGSTWATRLGVRGCNAFRWELEHGRPKRMAPMSFKVLHR